MRLRFLVPFAVLALIACVACEARGRSGPLTLERALEADWASLDVQVVTSMPADEKGGTAIVFLHGYGAKGSSYEPLARALSDERTRVFLPTAALPHSNGHGAMWWEFLDDDWPKPYSDDPTANAWPKPSKQLPRARQAVVGLIAQIRGRHGPDRVVIAGHSQGGMLALDVATSIEPPVDRVASLAGYVLLDSIPNIEKPRDARPMVFISHGRRDQVVAFDAAGRMKKLLDLNGFAVTFKPHDGDHGVSESTVRDLREFLSP